MKTVVASLAVALLATASITAQARTQKPAPRAAAGPAMAVTVTNGVGQPIEGVAVTVTGPVDRDGVTDGNGALRLAGTRAGTYRVRFEADGYITFEREVVIRAGVRTFQVNAKLDDAPVVEPPPPPPAPEPEPAPMALPPPGPPKTMTLLDWLDKNFITNTEPQKESIIGCSGLSQALVWQIRDPWSGRQHDDADGMFYVIGGEGTLRLGDTESPLAAGGFAVVPRGTTYAFTRRGRNPLIVLAVLAGTPCEAP
jgi:mannose-6-phosphate isomerase-like protein (cupin superfamily)